MDPRLAEIRSKLDRLRAIDVKRRVFGAHRSGGYGHDYQEYPTVDVAGIARLELDCGASLPEELAAFVRTVHGGGPGPGYGFDLWGEPPRSSRPFPYNHQDFTELMARRREDRYASLPMTDEDEDGCWPPGAGFLPIANLGCGVYDVIVVTGELRGTIWCCDMAWRPSTTDGGLDTFLDWYEDWLDGNLAPQSIARLLAP